MRRVRGHYCRHHFEHLNGFGYSDKIAVGEDGRAWIAEHL